METNELATLQTLAECCENGRVERMDWNELQKNDDPIKCVNVSKEFMAYIYKDFVILGRWHDIDANYLIKIRQS